MKYLGYLFFFMMLVIPGTYQGTRGALLTVLLFIALIHALRHGLRLHAWIAGLTVLCVMTSLVFMTWGSVNDAPGALRVGSVYVVWPLLFLFFIGVFHEFDFWEPYLKIIVLASITVEVMCILIVTDAIGITSTGIVNIIEANVGIYDGMSQLHTQNMGTLIFSVPYLVARLMTPARGSSDSSFWEKIEYATLFGGIIVLLLAGRKALLFVSLLAPLIAISFMVLTREKIQIARLTKLVMVGLVGLVLVNFIHPINFNVIWEFLASGFNFSGKEAVVTESAFRRKEQFIALISGWELNPLFGAGHGAAASDNIGMEADSWAYELQYIALLFQVGIVGTIIYAVSAVWLYSKAILMMQSNSSFRPLMIPLLAGLTGFLIANATNPYLAKFDYLWVLFLPVAVLNALLVHNKSIKLINNN